MDGEVNMSFSENYIDSNLILRAMNYYSSTFTLKDVPLCVDEESIFHSIPYDKRQYIIPQKRYNKNTGELSYYVGSAEQSFIYLHKKELINNGYYSAITPCQRTEYEDNLHLSIFLKMELILIGAHRRDELLEKALIFFSALGGRTEVTLSGNKPEEMDILINGIEVGSYGVGYMPDSTPYTYGTGIAEPRCSFALK